MGDEGERSFRWPDDTDKITEWCWKTVIDLLEKFETVFAEDMRENATYYVPRRGIYFTKALVDAADESFPAEITQHIPEKARAEWRSAGRCLAFNLLSASGFHVARAVEAMLEVYYQYFCGKGPDETLNGWHDYIVALEKAAGAVPPGAKTLAELRQMKDDFRNPVVHPRIVLSESDARMLFNNGESLIIAMAQDFRDAKKKDPEPQTDLLGLINTPALPAVPMPKPTKVKKPKPISPSATDLDLDPDAWPKFEKLIKSAAKMGPNPRPLSIRQLVSLDHPTAPNHMIRNKMNQRRSAL